MADKIYFKYISGGKKAFYECMEDGKFVTPYNRLNECFTNDVVLVFDKLEYEKIVEDYNKRIEEWEGTSNIRKQQDEKGYVYLKNDYGERSAIPVEKFILIRFMRKFKSIVKYRLLKENEIDT